ncbi:terminase gpA endonuclease subunit [Gemmobacter sp. LW-1]|uniref:terminase gpA endonuclease subunit n=1 Tax=Gemmobacter sp. LW-1 TaxID=1529005 RepID=UPI0035176034
MRGGNWQATAPGDGRTRGYHLPALLSPFETWAEIAAEHGRVAADPARLKSWVNTKLGETWEEEAAQTVDSGALSRRVEHWGGGLPPGVAVITAGIDTQDEWLAVELVGWGAGEESWSLGWHRLYGDLTGPAIWADLDKLLAQTFAHPLAGPLPVAAACMDSGGHHTQRVLEWTAARHGRRIYATKGGSQAARAAWPHRPTFSKTGKLPVYVIGVDAIKEVVFARLAKSEAGPGFCHVPAGREPAWFAEMVAEKPFTTYSKGRAIREWRKKSSERNEAFDCRIYAAAALEALKIGGFSVDQEGERIVGLAMAPGLSRSATVVRSKFLGG